jgi:hypothetical protein
MTTQQETAILGRLGALEYLYSLELGERFHKESDPMAVISRYEELMLSSLNVKAVMAGTSETELHKATVTAIKSIFSDARQFIRPD